MRFNVSLKRFCSIVVIAGMSYFVAGCGEEAARESRSTTGPVGAESASPSLPTGEARYPADLSVSTSSGSAAKPKAAAPAPRDAEARDCNQVNQGRSEIRAGA